MHNFIIIIIAFVFFVYEFAWWNPAGNIINVYNLLRNRNGYYLGFLCVLDFVQNLQFLMLKLIFVTFAIASHLNISC